MLCVFSVMASGEDNILIEGKDMPYIDYEDDMSELPPYQPSIHHQEQMMTLSNLAPRAQVSRHSTLDTRHQQLPVDPIYHRQAARDTLPSGYYGAPLGYEPPNVLVGARTPVAGAVRHPPPAGQFALHHQLRPASSVSIVSFKFTMFNLVVLSLLSKLHQID